MIYHWRDMIYGKMYDIISVPIIREAYIICEADIIATVISSVTAGNGYHCKKPLLSIKTKEVFYMVEWTMLKTNC